MSEPRTDLTRVTLAVIFIAALALASFWILAPFLPAVVWATMIVVATWPMLRRAEGWFGGRRGPAVLVLTLAMLVVFVLPLVVAIDALAGSAGAIADWVRRLPEQPFPPPPDWLATLPLVGPRAAGAWTGAAAEGFATTLAALEPYADDVARWLVAEAGAAGLVVVQCLLIIVLSAVFYTGGEAWAHWLRAFGRRLASEQGEKAVVLAGQAIRGVALGVVVTAVIQSALGGVGLAIAGVPLPGLLTAVMLILCIAQVGPTLVLLGATAWLFVTDATGWGSFLLAWSIVVGTMDNVLRPVLIRRGADLPLLLIFAGVIGGLLAFGLVGLFVGPVVLAVTWTLMDAWVRAGTPARGAGPTAGDAVAGKETAPPLPAGPSGAGQG
jgi:predicted PurR-regulated permease PerM